MVKNFTFHPMFRPSVKNLRLNRFFGNDIYAKYFTGESPRAFHPYKTLQVTVRRSTGNPGTRRRRSPGQSRYPGWTSPNPSPRGVLGQNGATGATLLNIRRLRCYIWCYISATRVLHFRSFALAKRVLMFCK